MNEEYAFFKNAAYFLKQGYLIRDILDICSHIYKDERIEQVKTKLNEGKTLDEAILECDFNRTFIEYFKFFRIKHDLATAILQSIEICKSKDETFKNLKKELTYPFLLVIFLILFSLFIVYGLLPSINQLFNEFAIKPSLVTQGLFLLFKVVPLIILIVLVIFSTLCIIALYAVNKQNFQLIDLFVNHISIIKKVIQKYYSIKFALYYNELLVSGYDTTEIIVMLYNQIDDSDIKMLIYEIYRKILKGESLEEIISKFNYFESLFIISFKLLLHDNRSDKSLNDYLKITLETLHFKVTRIIKIIVPVIYCFTAAFVVLVYVSIIIPMMSVMGSL